MAKLKQISLCLIAIFIASCSHFPTPTIDIKPSKSEQALISETQKQNIEIKKLNDKIFQLDKKITREFNEKISLGSASVYAANETLKVNPNKNKFTDAAGLALDVAIQALPEPSSVDLKKTIETQRMLISELAKENELGKQQIEAQKNEIKKKKENIESLEVEKEKIKEGVASLETEFIVRKDELIKKALEEKNQKLSAQQEALNKAEEKKELQLLIVKILSIAGLAFGFLAAFMKSPTLGILAAASIGLAISVSFIPTWMLVILLVSVFGGALLVILKEYKEHKTLAQNSVGSIQEFKQKNPELYTNELKPILTDWHGKDNIKMDGKVESVLKELNLK